MPDILQVITKAGYVPEKKANEVVNTGASGNGSEFIPYEVFSSIVLDVLPKRPGLLQLLPGNHGIGLPKKYTAACRGLSVGDIEFEGKSQWTTGTASQTEDDHSQQSGATKQVSISQNSFIAEIDISDEELRYAGANIEQYLRDRLADGMLYTADALILNGDTETGGTGNVNLVDAAPNSKKYYLKQDGARKLAYAGSYKADLSTLAIGDYATLLGGIGEYATVPQDVLFVQPIQVTMKALQLDEIIKVANSGDRASIQSGRVPTPFGSEILTHRAVKLADATGRVSNTGGNNTKGSIVTLYKPAIQYGWGQDFKLEAVRVAGYGWRLVATFDFGFTIVDSGTSLTNPSVYLGYNVTV